MNTSGKLNQKRNLIVADMLETYKDFASPIKLRKKLRRKHRRVIYSSILITIVFTLLALIILILEFQQKSFKFIDIINIAIPILVPLSSFVTLVTILFSKCICVDQTSNTFQSIFEYQSDMKFSFVDKFNIFDKEDQQIESLINYFENSRDGFMKKYSRILTLLSVLSIAIGSEIIPKIFDKIELTATNFYIIFLSLALSFFVLLVSDSSIQLSNSYKSEVESILRQVLVDKKWNNG